MATTVHIKNISSQTSETQVRDFFSFCGKIQNLSLSKDGEAQSAAVTFEKPTAAKTALLLDNTQLGPNLVNVTSAASLEEMSSPKSATGAGTQQDPSLYSEDVEQEDKPRSRIVAEYLAHGYTISDKAIERAIALDQTHGISTRFTTALSNFDQKYGATEKAQGIDAKYGVSEKAYAGWRGMNSYFEKAMGTPSGQRVHQFYQGGSKQVLDVHNEARRLANLQSGKPTGGPSESTGPTMAGGMVASGGTTDYEKAGMEKLPGSESTKCNCGGSTETCPCEPGKCACSSCAKNPEVTATGATAGGAV